MDDGFVKAVRLLTLDDQPEQRAGYPWDLPAIAALYRGLVLHEKVTYLIGENGSGKSTMLEAIAVAAGMNAEGGSSNFAFSTRAPPIPSSGRTSASCEASADPRPTSS